MKTSVIISTYNGIKYIEDQLESIRNQSLSPDEVLIFDDGSNDGTVDFIKKFIEKNNLTSWNFVQNDINKGWEKNFWDGIGKTSGELIFTCDQDDIWCKDKIMISKKYMENYSINLLVSNYESFYEDGTNNLGHKINEVNPSMIEMDLSFFDVRYPGCTYCFRKTFYDDISGYWHEKFPHDAMLWRYSQLTNSLYCANEVLIKWRRHNNSAFTVESRMNKTRHKKIDWINYANDFVDEMLAYSRTHHVCDNNVIFIQKYKKWLKKRYEFLNDRNILRGFSLIRNIEEYGSVKRYIGDWYLLIRSK